MKKILGRFIKWVLVLFFSTTILAVVLYRFVPVYVTPLMVIRGFEQADKGGSLFIHHTWVSIDEISPYLPIAVMASEDQRFLLHHGFDYSAIEKAAIHNMKNTGKKYGASTISQQTAKNVFLWPGRDWVRKGLEVYFTAMIELFWSKQRIMEVYLNSIEMGEGVFGASAVAKYHFDKAAIDLSRADCALIAATLPNPIKFNSAQPDSYIRKRQRQIEQQMKFIPVFPKEHEDINPKTVKGGVYKR